ncbi:MAG: GFA family protein [PS1 clade bacterium]|nr:GFA family protein [PS1 clade bacterium]
MSKRTGGCYCGGLRYESDGDMLMKAACHCRECQYISGGGANMIAGVADDGFTYTKGAPAQYTRDDIDDAVTREFCGQCGSPMVSRVPATPGVIYVKVGSLDDPAEFGKPDVAIHTDDKFDFHAIADGVAQFGKLPG